METTGYFNAFAFAVNGKTTVVASIPGPGLRLCLFVYLFVCVVLCCMCEFVCVCVCAIECVSMRVFLCLWLVYFIVAL